MDYEKKYKEALGWMQSLYNGLHGKTKEDAEHYFPELRKSEDERIRKELIFYLGDMPEDTELRNGITNRDVLAWLEKQGEKKPIMNIPTREVILAIWDLGNEWKELTNGSISTKYGTQLDYIQKHWHESEYYLREKQGEQKVPINDFKAKNWYVSEVDGKIHDMTYNPADKVEPKFKVRDWIVNDQGSAFQIAYIDTENYRYVFEIGGYTKEEMNYENIAFANNHYRKWTLDDAKDGDVLVDDLDNICIYQESSTKFMYHSYCYGNNKYFVNSGGSHQIVGTCPATKEQRDTLLKAMADAGYTFDFEKKELKLLISNDGDFESNNSKQNPTWGEDDERIVTALMEGFRYHQLFNPRFGEVPNAEIIDWIKSLKERLS